MLKKKVFIFYSRSCSKTIGLANFLLGDINNYRFLNNGNVIVPNVDDGTEFHNTVRSMKIMGFHEEEITCLLILHDLLTSYIKLHISNLLCISKFLKKFSCIACGQRCAFVLKSGVHSGEKV